MKRTLVLFLALVLAGCSSVPMDDAPYGKGSGARDLSLVDDGSADEANSPAKPIHMEVPEYPQYLKRQGISGIVTVYFEVAVDGRVTDAYAAESPHPDLSTAAVAAIMKSTFEPALVEGVPIESHMSVPVRFDLD